MDDLVLVIGNKNLSSWSLRPWLLLAHAEIPFREEVLLFGSLQWKETVQKDAPTGKVPVLRHGDLRVWESLAICEYVAELFPEKKLWPDDRAARALARSLSCEMHAGYTALRHECPMNIVLRKTGHVLSAAAAADALRVEQLVGDQLARSGGPFLFGRFSIADAMFAPVATRFVSYGLPRSKAMRSFSDAIFELSAMNRWVEGARAERST